MGRSARRPCISSVGPIIVCSLGGGYRRKASTTALSSAGPLASSGGGAPAAPRMHRKIVRALIATLWLAAACCSRAQRASVTPPRAATALHRSSFWSATRLERHCITFSHIAAVTFRPSPGPAASSASSRPFVIAAGLAPSPLRLNMMPTSPRPRTVAAAAPASPAFLSASTIAVLRSIASGSCANARPVKSSSIHAWTAPKAALMRSGSADAPRTTSAILAQVGSGGSSRNGAALAAAGELAPTHAAQNLGQQGAVAPVHSSGGALRDQWSEPTTGNAAQASQANFLENDMVPIRL